MTSRLLTSSPPDIEPPDLEPEEGDEEELPPPPIGAAMAAAGSAVGDTAVLQCGMDTPKAWAKPSLVMDRVAALCFAAAAAQRLCIPFGAVLCCAVHVQCCDVLFCAVLSVQLSSVLCSQQE